MICQIRYVDLRVQWFLLLVLFFILSIPCAYSQEGDFYKRFIKESIDMDMVLKMMTPETKYDTNTDYEVFELNINKAPLPISGYNHKQCALFNSYKEPSPSYNQYSVSPYALGYLPNDGFDPNSTETTGDIIANGILTPIAAVGTLNILVLADYLMRIGVLPSEPFVPRETKKQKALREIKGLCGVE
ncbi:hypothetical protein LJB98_00930 [Bacteroidales bacterium OttesenSCG-928-M11]|nr:hypothetical protein [Bacteroidales bacterium OttesenSCG-928-M11]